MTEYLSQVKDGAKIDVLLFALIRLPFPTEFANRFKRLNLDIFITLIMGISSYLAKPPDALYGTVKYDRAFIQKEGLQKRL